jgi:excisionase family DNA binding protein
MPSQTQFPRVQVSKKAPRRTLISIEQAAEILGCTDRSIRRWIAEGRLPAYRLVNKLVRLDADDVYGLLRPIPTAGGSHDDAA